MSTTYSMACRRCRQKLWIAQSSGAGGLHIYEKPELERFSRFLENHLGHELVCVADSDEGEAAEFEEMP